VQRADIARLLDAGMLGVGTATVSSVGVMGAGLVLRVSAAREVECVGWVMGLCVVRWERYVLMVRKGSVVPRERLRVPRGHAVRGSK
jgi:hypothetical protein